MYIRKVEIKNIQSIKEFRMEFPEGQEAGWHVLIGDNGAGKSTIVKSCALTIIGPYDVQALRLPLSNWIRKDENIAEVSMTIFRDNKYDLYAENVSPMLESIDIGVNITREINSGFEIGRLTYNGKHVQSEEHIWNGRLGWFAASFGSFRRFAGGNNEWSKVYYSNPRAAPHLSVFGEDVALTSSLEWLAMLKFKSYESYRPAINILNGIKKFINEGGLLPYGIQLHEVTSEGVFFKDGNGFEIDVTQMSHGYRSLLSMIFEVIRQLANTYGENEVFEGVVADNPVINQPGIILIDEIDIHLHPLWQTRIGQWFTKYFPNIQFIVTTHSPLICRGCVNEEGKINGTIWHLAAPGSEEQSGLLSDTDRDRLVYGNVLDAYGTGVFGTTTSRSEEGNTKMNRLAELNVKSRIGAITADEEKEMQELKTIFPTHA